ncbi:MAG TPA: HSP20 family small heat-shock protein, partial [Myxococcaceae bacterium]|nr:HSP20 family small heat-shock protein [Myxococcaceae bacterium]
MAIIPKRETTGGSALSSRRFDPFEMMRDMLRWDPFQEMQRWGGAGGGEGLVFTPSFEVKETKDSYVFKADLPGIKEGDLDISLTGNRLTISGKREEEKRDEGEQFFTYERSYGSFSRSFTLPGGVDVEHVNADLKDGVLSVVVPKKPEVQPKRIQ